MKKITHSLKLICLAFLFYGLYACSKTETAPQTSTSGTTTGGTATGGTATGGTTTGGTATGGTATGGTTTGGTATGGTTTGGTTTGGTTTGGTTTGTCTFWTKSDLGVGNIYVSVDGVSKGTISHSHSSGVTCGAGDVNVVLAPGTYNYRATTDAGGGWSGTITIVAGNCERRELVKENSGGGGTSSSGTTTPANTGTFTLFTTSDLKVGAIDVYINNVFKGTISHFHANGVTCGEGDVNVVLTGGTYLFTAKSANGTKWEKNITVTNGICSGFELTTAGVSGMGGNNTGSDATTEGKGIFWTNKSTGWSYIDVYLGGVFAGRMSQYYDKTPTCESNGGVVITKKPGTYAYTAKSDNGSQWSGSIIILPNGGCTNLLLDFNNTGGGGSSTNNESKVVFWTTQSKYGKIEIYMDNIYRGTLTNSYASSPACGASGCVTVTVVGNHTWNAKSQTSTGNHSWTGSYTLKPGCTSLELL